MPSQSFPTSHLRQLFFFQVCLLAGVAGILAQRHMGPGLTLLGLLWVLDWPRSRSVAGSACIIIAFLLGFGYAHLCEPMPEPVPPWLTTAARPVTIEDGVRSRPQSVRLEADVVSCALLPNNRARIILRDAAPVEIAAPSQPPGSLPGMAGSHAGPEKTLADVAYGRAYPGRIVWNWRNPGPPPAPGERLAVTLRLAEVRGFANEGIWDIDRYWHDRRVWYRAWSGSNADVRSVSSAPWPGRLRLVLRERVYANLPEKRNQSREQGSWFPRPFGLEMSGPVESGTPEPLPGLKRPEKSRSDGTVAGRSRPSQGAAIIPALLFADRSGISEETSDLFSRATLAHSLALSGLHLGFAVLAGFWAAKALGRLFPRLWLKLPRPKAAILLSLPVAGAYLWLGQAPISLVRASCMLGFWALLLWLNKPRVLLDGLFAALAVILVWDPMALHDVGLQLSALSVAVIALCLPGLTRISEGLFPKARHWSGIGGLLRGCVLVLGTSLCIQVVLFPLLVKTFGSSGLLFPLNLLWLPVLGAVVLPLSFAGLFFSALGLDGAASALLYGATLPCEGLFWLLHWLDSTGLLAAPLLPRPRWPTIAGWWLLCLSLPALLRGSKTGGGWRSDTVSPAQEGRPQPTCLIRSGARLVLAGVVLLLLPVAVDWLDQSRPQVRLRLVDVGQGQSVLIEWQGLDAPDRTMAERAMPARGRVLVDGGGFPGSSFDPGRAILAPLLTDNALPQLDAVIASHPDTDHLAGLLFLLERFRVGAYYGNGDRPSTGLGNRERNVLGTSGLEQKVLRAGDSLRLAPGLVMEVLWPPEGHDRSLGLDARQRKEEGGNNLSLILRLVWEGAPLALLCGDAEIPALQMLLERNREGVKSSVLVLPHHGAASSLLPDFYQAVGPEFALAAAGYGNRWGFPAPQVHDALRRLGIPMFSTAEQGQVRVTWPGPGQRPHVGFALQGGGDGEDGDERTGRTPSRL